MHREIDQLKPVLPDLFSPGRGSEKTPALLGGVCRDCSRHFFPRPKYCPNCLKKVDQVPLKSDGAVYSYTIVRVKPPFGLPSPYSVVYVDLSEIDLRVFGLFDPEAAESLRIGLKVELAAGPLGVDSSGQPCLRPYFTPRANDGK